MFIGLLMEFVCCQYKSHLSGSISNADGSNIFLVLMYFEIETANKKTNIYRLNNGSLDKTMMSKRSLKLVGGMSREAFFVIFRRI